MSTVLVTIVGPGGRADAAAAGDAPVAELLPAFAALSGAGGRAGWELGAPGAAPLRGEASLAKQGIVDGALLELRPAGAAPIVAPAVAVVAAPPDDGSSPVARTRDALPEWFGARARLGAAVRAPRERDLDVSRTASIRAAWQASDYARALDDAIAAPRLRRAVTVAVAGAAPGAGCTTVAMLLAALLARRRGGTTVRLENWAGGERSTMPPGNPGIVVLDAGGERSTMPPGEPGVVVLDAGTAPHVAADVVVLVVAPGPAARGQLAAAALDRAAPIVLAVNRVPRGADVADLEGAVPRARGLVAIGEHGAIASGRAAWERPGPAWSLPLRELGALLAGEWRRLGLT